MMRFLLLMKQVCVGMCRGIQKEVMQLSEVSDLNSQVKQVREEIRRCYQELGEYVYQQEIRLEEESLQELYFELDCLNQQLMDCQNHLMKIKGTDE